LTTTTTYYAQARNTTTGCTSASRLAVTGTVNPDVAQATITGNSSNSCPTKTVPLTATATGATGYTWYRNGSQVQKSTSPNYTVSSAGNYTVIGYNAYCSGATSSSKYISINDCGSVPGCTGFSVVNANVSHDGEANLSDAVERCNAMGGRLPTYNEIHCMCNNKSTVPGGFKNAWYWISGGAPNASHNVYSSALCTPGQEPSSTTWNYRCVR
jgi:hypothetical protein